MPRQNGPRTMNVEEFVARRMEAERRSHKWSYETLAKRMSQLGCTIQASAIQRIEKGDPPRKISVDEAVAMAKVFKLSLDEFLQEGDNAIDAKLRGSLAEAELLWLEMERAEQEMSRARNSYGSAVIALAELVRDADSEIAQRFAQLRAEAEAAKRANSNGDGVEVVLVFNDVALQVQSPGSKFAWLER